MLRREQAITLSEGNKEIEETFNIDVNPFDVGQSKKYWHAICKNTLYETR